MTRLPVIAALIVVTMATCAQPGFADVRVTPRPKDASIQLKAGKMRPHQSGHRSAHPTSTRTRSKVFEPRSRPPDPSAWSNPDPNSWFEPGQTRRATNETSPTCSELLDGKFRCTNPDPENEPTDKKDGKKKAPKKLSPGQILSAVREVGLPSVKIDIQPGGATLVNFDTIFYADPLDVRRTINLLGFQIDVVATPTRYRWHHGDGTTQFTNEPGRPYPHKDITHRYESTATNVHPSVDISYTIRYRVDSGGWQKLDTPVTASGPTANLQVKEATALLTAS